MFYYQKSQNYNNINFKTYIIQHFLYNYFDSSLLLILLKPS
jgi:hypothetical protein